MTTEEKKRQYTDLCSRSKITSLFIQPWWLDANGPWDVSLAIRNGQLVGAMPFAYRKRWGLTYIGMPVLTHHLGIWMDKPPDVSAHKWLTREKQIIWLLIDDLPRKAFFSMVFSERSFDNWLPFYWKGFRQEMKYTFILHRDSGEVIDQHLNRNLKRNIHQASENIQIRPFDDVDAFYTICRNTFERQKMKIPYSLSLLQSIHNAIRDNHAGALLGAFNTNDELVSAAYLLWDKEKAYYWLAGDYPEGRDSGAGILLCREAIRIAFEEKQTQAFDFCGSMLEPVTELRRQFGAQATPLMKIFKANSRWLDIMYSLTR